MVPDTIWEMKMEVESIEEWVNDQPECIASPEYLQAASWAMNQMGIECGSGASSLAMGATAIVAGILAM